ncbi:MAG TPA: hypothetical protein VFH26_09480 [Gemmatimonadales bacterium]|nr:hypothetical protein [Gemmatimonadales bacterium]
MTPNKINRLVPAAVALIAFVWAARSAHDSAMPEFKVYDGYWMMLGAALAVGLVAPLVWRWPRERSLPLVVMASVVGSVVPLVVSAFTHNLPIMARLRGSWMLAGADLVGPAVVVGFTCLWLAIRDEAPRRQR